VHPVHLARTFRRVHQITFAGYVRHVRIEFARRELAALESPLGDIAVAAGFCDQSHFSRLFKRYTGLTPAEYRLACRRAKTIPARWPRARRAAVRCGRLARMGLFSKKSFADLHAEADRGLLRRSLGPWNLTALGIGSIIGTGIFVFTGVAASQNAGPALVLSMIISAVGCAFSGLCYAEFAAMVPVAGSAYTYAYATMGELIAWIIGWDLILEYALSVATVAVGWSGYFVSLAHDAGIVIPASLVSPPPDGLFNLPAAAIVLIVAALLVIGIKQSADTNTLLVAIKVAVLIVFVVAGASYVKRANLTPFIPPNTGPFGSFGWSGVLRGAGVMFLPTSASTPCRRRLRRRATRRATCRSGFSDRWRSAR